MPDSTFLKRLSAVVSPSAVVTDPVALIAYTHDKSPFEGLDPLAAVKATSTDDVAAVLRLATASGTPVITRGGGFSLGGSPAHSGDRPIVIDTRAMNRIVDIDEASMTVTAECGILMQDLHEAVAARGYEVHTVAVPRAYTTLGGVLSGVCGGGFPVDTAAVGGSGQFVHGLRVVLPEGTILDTNAGGSNSYRNSSSVGVGDGPQLTQLFVGDGGALGVKVEATLALTPARTAVAWRGYEFAALEPAMAALSELQRVPEVPYANLYLTKGAGWSLTFTARASTEELLALHLAVLTGVIERHGGVPGSAELQESAREIAAMDPAWSEQFVRVDRGAIAAVFGNRDFPAAFADFCGEIDARVQGQLGALGVEPITFISPYGPHAIWCAITLPYDPGTPGARAAVGEATIAAYELIIARGGWCEPHQGRVSHAIARAWSPAYASFIARLRQDLDPGRVLNAGVWTDPQPASQAAYASKV